MSMWDYLFDSEFKQRRDIQKLRTRQEELHDKTFYSQRSTTRRLDDLEIERGELALYCRAAVQLMIEKKLITTEDFVNKMHEIDASDGKVDGAYTPS